MALMNACTCDNVPNIQITDTHQFCVMKCFKDLTSLRVTECNNLDCHVLSMPHLPFQRSHCLCILVHC